MPNDVPGSGAAAARARATPIAGLWRQRQLIREKADALYRLAQRSAGVLPEPGPGGRACFGAGTNEDAAPPEARIELDKTSFDPRSTEEEEGALNRRAHLLGEQLAGMQATTIGDVLVQLELFAESFFEEPGFADGGERALFEKIVSGLRALAQDGG